VSLCYATTNAVLEMRSKRDVGKTNRGSGGSKDKEIMGSVTDEETMEGGI